MIADGYTAVDPGKIASVVTYLEMLARPEALVVSDPAPFVVERVEKPALDWYRRLYRRVGEEWLWFNRLRMTDDELTRILHDPLVDVFALTDDTGQEAKGLLELDRRCEAEVEIAYFGLTSDLVGRGAGRYLLRYALDAAWARQPRRVWVHTCTLDHPRALPFYLKAGFTPYQRAVEIADDPRLTGEVPRSAAPHIPLLTA